MGGVISIHPVQSPLRRLRLLGAALPRLLDGCGLLRRRHDVWRGALALPACASDATGQMPFTSLLTLALSQNTPPVLAPVYEIFSWMPLRSDALTEPFSGTYAKRVVPPSPSLSLSIAPGHKRLTLSRSSDHAALVALRPPVDVSQTASTAAFALDAMRSILRSNSLTALAVAVAVVIGADIGVSRLSGT